VSENIPGIHHVTAIAGDPRRNLAFYAGVLGLRLVKRTVNYDDPNTYHLYYGDESGRPGTILTFFPWPGAPRGSDGTGQGTVTAFSIPARSMEYWMERLAGDGIAWEGPSRRFDESSLSFADPDGLRLELRDDPGAEAEPAWKAGPVPPEFAVRGLHGVTLALDAHEGTASLLTEVMGFRRVASEGDRIRYQAANGALASRVDLLALPGSPRGRMGVGVVHHVAWRTSDDEEQRAWRARIAAHGLHPTPVYDRQYFRSVYFREPGGVLFEIATDTPGFGVDETPERLGTGLKLPPWLEPDRQRIERILPPLETPGVSKAR